MCILINHPANTNFSDELLADFHDFNSDGFGAMYAEAGKLVVVKTLGTPQQIEAIYKKELAHRDCIIHYRMKTHGNIDLDNCHPYRINDDVWMAHNGILAMGNPILKAKSDTWHFIEFILRPALNADPDLLFDQDYQEYMASMIGASNKFAFMHSSGQSVIINEQAGVKHQGAWLSNTYAWSAHKYGHGARYASPVGYGMYNTTSTKSYSSSLSAWDQFNAEDDGVDYDIVDSSYDVRPKGSKKMNYNKVLRAAYNCYRRGSLQLVDWVLAAPDKAEFLLLEWYGEAHEYEMAEMVHSDPDGAAEMIYTLFSDGSVNESEIL